MFLMLTDCEIGLVWHLCASWQRPSCEILSMMLLSHKMCVNQGNHSNIYIAIVKNIYKVFGTNANTHKAKACFNISSKLNLKSSHALWLQKDLLSESDRLEPHLIACHVFCTLCLHIYEVLLAGFVAVVVHCCQVRLVVCIHASWKESQQSVLSCLPQSVNWRASKLSGQRGVKRNPGDSNKRHTFQSSWDCRKKIKIKITRPVKCSLGLNLFEDGERCVVKVRKTIRAFLKQTMRERSAIGILGEKKTVTFHDFTPREIAWALVSCIFSKNNHKLCLCSAD